MSLRRYRSAFVVTVSTLTLSSACTTRTNAGVEAGGGQPQATPDPAPRATTARPELKTANPPPPAPVAVDIDKDAFRVREPEGAIDWDAYREPVNARNAEGKQIYRSMDACYVQGERREPPRSWAPAPQVAEDCPPIMAAAHWTHCQHGTLYGSPGGDTCVCARDGNPPPPPHFQDCPSE